MHVLAARTGDAFISIVYFILGRFIVNKNRLKKALHKVSCAGLVWAGLAACGNPQDQVSAVNRWMQATAHAAFSPRSFHTAVAFGGKMWVIGGNDGSYKNDVWSSPDGAAWTQVLPAGQIFSGRSGHTSVVFDNKMWVIGGNDGSYKNDVWSSPDGATWTQVAQGPIFTGRCGHASLVHDGKIWVLGGYYYDGNPNTLNDAWYSSDGESWNQAAVTQAFSNRRYHTAVSLNGVIWVIGGDCSNPYNIFNDAWYSSTGTYWTQSTDTVQTESPTGHLGGCAQTTVVLNNCMWNIGGYYDGEYKNDVYCSYGGHTWIRRDLSDVFSARCGHASIVFKDQLWVIGGTGNGGNTNDVYYIY
jgi:leucine-zipper-like transcriptional regulator 1